MSQSGKLHVVATPIGNLQDITMRALETLKQVDLILVEDTRTFGKLAATYGLKNKLLSYHEHNEKSRSEDLVRRLESGESAALVSDAGTPGICDPGYRVVRACRQAGIEVVALPGPSALLAALSISGLPTDSFFFAGFLPKQNKKKRDLLSQLIELDSSIVFYESPHRIEATLETLNAITPEREIFLGRELTKIHETGYFGTPSQVLDSLRTKTSGSNQIRGEIVVVVSKALRSNKKLA